MDQINSRSDQKDNSRHCFDLDVDTYAQEFTQGKRDNAPENKKK